jgi:hypothetical protein
MAEELLCRKMKLVSAEPCMPSMTSEACTRSTASCTLSLPKLGTSSDTLEYVDLMYCSSRCLGGGGGVLSVRRQGHSQGLCQGLGRWPLRHGIRIDSSSRRAVEDTHVCVCFFLGGGDCVHHPGRV